ncbi:MAG: hypothetical protein Roseis2KO_33490 [Roseivirga sp.]
MFNASMIYHRQPPGEALHHLINCYWHIDSEGDTAVETQKIVPDGYPEIILHYGNAYEINLEGSWQAQSLHLLAGQIRHYFYLRNTGASGMIGIKLQPTALTCLFGLDQSTITDKVIELSERLTQVLFPVISTLKPDLSTTAVFKQLDDIFLHLTDHTVLAPEVDTGLKLIMERNGNIGVNELTQTIGCSERKLERLFKRFVGLSPKFYARIIRLSYIFELMQEGDKSWSDLVYDSGFYDQSHFIKNFKEFTGEDPSSYGFDERNMANFHLRK